MAARGKTDAEQRRALLMAMAALVPRGGYRSVRTADLANAAGVSKSTLYLHFGGKRGCFAALVEPIVEKTARAVEEAARRGRGPQGRLRAALGTLLALTLLDPEGARLVLVDSLALGAAGVPFRGRTARRFEAIGSGIFAEEAAPISPTAAAAIVAGIGGVLRRGLRDGRAEELRGLSGELAGWALRIADEDEDGLTPLPSLKDTGPERKRGKVPWDEVPRSTHVRRTLDRRERFVRAAAWVVVERGYDALSIPAISAAAGSSNQAFYSYFRDKREPLFEAYDRLSEQMVAACCDVQAQQTLTGAASGGVEALRGDGAAATAFARLAFVELPSIDERGMERAEAALDRLCSTLLAAPAAPLGLVAEAERGALSGLLEAALLRCR